MADRVKKTNSPNRSIGLAGRVVGGVLAALLLAGGLAVSAAPAAEPLAAPTGRVVLTVGGDVARTNGNGKARFDLAMIKALGIRTVRTSTPWTEGVSEFEGVLVRDVLAAVGSRGTMFRATALDDYAVDIPLKDVASHDVILAFKLNGEVLNVRTKGPLWIIYPWDARPELKAEAFYNRAVWHLTEMVVQ